MGYKYCDNLMGPVNITVVSRESSEAAQMCRFVGCTAEDQKLYIVCENKQIMFKLPIELFVILQRDRVVVLHNKNLSYVISLPIVIPEY